MLRRFDVCFLNKVGSVGNLNQIHVTLFLLLVALQQNAAQYTILELASKQLLSLSTVNDWKVPVS